MCLSWCLVLVYFAHRGVVNRDLKPENLLLKKKYNSQEVSCTMENLRCVDFGSASQLEAGVMPGQSLTSHNLLFSVAGKRGYCWIMFRLVCLLLHLSDLPYSDTTVCLLECCMLFAGPI